MSIDTELIAAENYNSKIKAYLRDFFSYQFKEKNTDFKTQGNKTECKSFRALAPGTTIITATTDNGVTCRCSVTVKSNKKDRGNPQKNAAKSDVLPQNIAFKTDSVDMQAGNTRKIAVSVSPEDATNRITYISSDDTVAKVVAGKILAIKQGACTITATTVNGLTASCSVTVDGVEVLPTSLKVDYQQIEVRAGDEFKLTAFMEPNNTTHREVFWHCSDPSVVAVSAETTVGMFLDELLNKDIGDRVFNYDADRLRQNLEKAAGIQWSKGDVADPVTGEVDKHKKNKRVECITADSRTIAGNPFFSTYTLCSESADSAGTHFAFLYAILLYFRLGKTVFRSDYKPLTEDQHRQLTEHLILDAGTVESIVHRHRPRPWEDFTEEEKTKFALEAIERFSNEHSGLEDIYDHIVLYKKKIVYANGKFMLEDDDSLLVEKSDLYNMLCKHYGLQITQKQFANKMQEFDRLGIIITEKRGRKIYYTLSDAYLSNMLGDDADLIQRFVDCIGFFAQTSTLGEIGSYILNRLPQYQVGSLRFKHRYITRALCDYNNIDLLTAVKHNACDHLEKIYAIIEYRNAAQDDMMYQRVVCIPMEIRESVTNGRQYLIYYHLGKRSVSAVRVEFIDSITLGHLPKSEHLDDDIQRVRELINSTWGTAFNNFDEGNVKHLFAPHHLRFIVCFDESEDFIRARLHRETRRFATIKEMDSEQYGHCIEVTADVAHPWEMLQWIRTYIGRLALLQIDGKTYNPLAQDIKRMKVAYERESPRFPKNVSSRKGKALLYDDIPADFVPIDNMHSLLFNEIFGISFRGLGEVLFSLLKEKTVTKENLTQWKRDYARRFSDFSRQAQREKQALGFLELFITDKGNGKESAFSLTEEGTLSSAIDLLPLTSLEIQWMINVLSLPLARCFLQQEEIDRIRDWLGESDLFDANSVTLYDQFVGMKEYYQDPFVCDSVQKIMTAIRQKQWVVIKYKPDGGEESNDLCAPVYVEYSRRDNKIRIQAVRKSGQPKTFNVECIRNVTIKQDATFDQAGVEATVRKWMDKKQRELVLVFSETKNIPDRVLTEFSCWDKRCLKVGYDRYQLSLSYHKEDAREILIRLLSYGSLIHVRQDEGTVLKELKERVEKQSTLIQRYWSHDS